MDQRFGMFGNHIQTFIESVNEMTVQQSIMNKDMKKMKEKIKDEKSRVDNMFENLNKMSDILKKNTSDIKKDRKKPNQTQILQEKKL